MPSQPVQDGKLAAVASLVAAMIGFGAIPIFLRHFAGSLDAWTVNGIRYSVGALFWLPFLLFLDRRPEAGTGPSFADASPSSAPTVAGEKCACPPRTCPLQPSGNVWRDALVPSVVNAIGQAGFGISPYYVSASTIGFVLRLSFLFTIIFGFIVLVEERLLARKSSFWWGAALSLVGVLVMFFDEFREGGEGSLPGLAIILVTALAWGGYSVSVRHYVAHYSARQSFGVISLYTSAALVVSMFLFGNAASLASIGAWLWFNLMASALIGIAFGHVLYYRGIHRLGPVVASGILLVTPFITCLFAWIFLDERLSSLGWLGEAFVVLGGGLLVAARAQIEGEAVPTSADLDDQAGGQV
jgi:drug/metabolite transporter (DMT)-like permease